MVLSKMQDQQHWEQLQQVAERFHTSTQGYSLLDAWKSPKHASPPEGTIDIIIIKIKQNT